VPTPVWEAKFPHPVNEGRAGAAGRSTKSMTLGAFEVPQFVLFDQRKTTARHDRVGRITLGHHGCAKPSVLPQRFREDGGTLKDQAFAGINHAIHDGAFEELPAGTHHHPAHAMEPAAIVQGAQEPFDISTVLDENEDV